MSTFTEGATLGSVNDTGNGAEPLVQAKAFSVSELEPQEVRSISLLPKVELCADTLIESVEKVGLICVDVKQVKSIADWE